MEIEYFVMPGEDEKCHQEWVEARKNWYIRYGIKPENIRLYNQKKEELAHYAKATVDIHYRFFPDRPEEDKQFDEVEGVANRTDFDLSCHTKGGKLVLADGREFPNTDATNKLTYFDPKTNQHLLPYVIEPSCGVDRATLAFMMDAYCEEEVKEGDTRVVLKLHPALAPIKVAVLPLKKNNEDIKATAHKIKKILLGSGFRTVYDDTAGIGKLYRRQDEVGTPFCVTVDFQTLEDQTVTVRDRDTMAQERVAIDDLKEYIAKRIGHND